MNKRTIPLKPYSITELTKLYSVCDRTFKKWVKPFEEVIGKKQGRYYTVTQVKIIFEKLGIPGEIETD